MEQPKRISRLALFALFAALLIALGGLALQRNDIAPFWGGLLLAFGVGAAPLSVRRAPAAPLEFGAAGRSFAIEPGEGRLDGAAGRFESTSVMVRSIVHKIEETQM